MVVGEFTQETELVIIGAGPGGYAAAFRAAELGMQTLVVDDRDAWGGVCLHAGCIPSKTLLHLAEIAGVADVAPLFGIKYDPPQLDLKKMRDWVELSVNRLAAGLAGRAKKLGVEFIQGRARFEDQKNLAIRDSTVPRIKFRRAIIATGSSPRPHDLLPFEHPRVWTPSAALEISKVPKRLLVLGSGYMPIELATMYRAFGSAVVLASEDAGIVPGADVDLQRPLLKRIEKTGVRMMVDVTIERTNDVKGGVEVRLTHSGGDMKETFDRVIVAIGQRGNTGDLNLNAIGVHPDDNGFVAVGEQMRTSSARVLAVGDVTGPPLLADRALRQGRVAAEVLAGWKSAFDARAIPHTVFTDPQLAWCGLTEAQASTEGYHFAVQKVPWGASGRAVGMGRADGLTKLIYDVDTKLVLGIGLVGRGAAEMIGEAALAIEMGAELTDLAETIHPHPSMSELLSDAAQSAAEKT